MTYGLQILIQVMSVLSGVKGDAQIIIINLLLVTKVAILQLIKLHMLFQRF